MPCYETTQPLQPPIQNSVAYGPIKFVIKGIGHTPSFKNKKIAVRHRTNGKQMQITEPKTKNRMRALEDAIVLALYSLSQTTGPGTPTECLKQLRTALSGLCDDSIKQIPSGSWDVRYVPVGEEGLEITIQEIC